MSAAEPPADEARALVLAPFGRDAGVAAAILREAGLAAEACPDLDALAREIGRGAGLAVVAEEVLATGDAHALSRLLAGQPPWSDFPFVLLTRRAGGSERNPAALRALDLLGNVAFVERPFQPVTLVSAARGALRARRRQYQARDHLAEREAAAAVLAEAHRRTADILESIDLAFYAVDRDWRLTYVNRHVERLWGRRREDLLGRSLWDQFPGVDVAATEGYRLHHRVARERRPERAEFMSLTLGTWAEVSIYPAPDGGLSVYLRDVTDRRHAEEELRASEARLRAVYDTLQTGIAEGALDAGIINANEAFCRIVGYDRNELVSMNYFDITHPDDVGADADLYRRLQAGEIPSYRLEKRYVRKDGTPVWIDLTTSLVRDAEGRPLYGVGAVQDISERKAAEARQELLLAELSHRVKNMLAVILAIASQTAARAPTTAAFVAGFRGRLGALAAAHDLLTATGWRSVSLADLARRTLAPHFADGGNRLAVDLPDDVPLDPALAQTLALAFHELATNAAKHGALSAPEGTVSLTAGLTGANGADPAAGRELRLLWREQGGPPVTPPQTRGFGTTLLGRALGHQHGGRVELEWPPQGLLCRMSLRVGAAA